MNQWKAMTFGRLTDLLTNSKGLGINLALLHVFKKEANTDLVLLLNTDEQLFQGLDAEGKSLKEIGGGYAPLTIELKRLKGQPTDRVTLYDTGEFYNSFRVFAGKTHLDITADTLKEGDVDLQDRYGRNLLGLNDDSITQLAIAISDDVATFALETLLNGN